MAYYVPPFEKVGGHVPRVPHQIAPMAVIRISYFPFVSYNEFHMLHPANM